MNLRSLFFKSSIFLLIKYTILEQMSRKISQINFSFIQHLYVGDDLYITDYEHIFFRFSVGSGFFFEGGGRRRTGAECGGFRCTVATPGQRHLHAYCTYMVVLQIHQESVHDLFFHKKPQFF